MTERGGREVALGGIVEQRFDQVVHLLQGERAVADAEQGEGNQRRRGDRRDLIDAVEDLEGDLVETSPERRLVVARKSLSQWERFPKTHIGFTEHSALLLGVAGEPLEPLFRLGDAGLFRPHCPHFLRL